jgi:anti-sigma factor RsiW
VNRTVPAATFALPRPAAGTARIDQGFVRTSPAAAARRLSYVPHLPTQLPQGFRLAVAGWAPRSGTTGPEGSIPRARQLFAAVYRRGIERVDLTQRLAPAGGWANDPFGGECVRMFTERATIGGATAVYGAGPSTTPHLYWRSGRILYTVSGPFPKAELAAIARSLRPVR